MASTNLSSTAPRRLSAADVATRREDTSIMRIFTAWLGTETHTWAPLPTDDKVFEDTCLARGKASKNRAELQNPYWLRGAIWADTATTRTSATF